MRLLIDAWLDYALHAPADLLLALEVAPLADQHLVVDRLATVGTGPLVPVRSHDGLGRRTWTRAEGRFSAHYTATLDVERAGRSLAGLRADPLPTLPGAVVPYLFPSRYCGSDRFESFVLRTFPGLAGGDLIDAIAAWIHRHIDYRPGVTTPQTTAADSFLSAAGVCRDFAHLLIAMARAADIPARMVAAYAWQLVPEDFHAVAEVWLAGEWHLVDATRLAPIDGIARIVAGRDATDIAFLTIFGSATLIEQRVSVTLA